MNITLTGAAVAAALIGLGGAAVAQDSMMAKPMPAHMATMLCRPADSGEKATAMMGTKSLVCKPVDMKGIMAMKKDLDAMPKGDPEWLKMINMLQVGPGINNS